jgi:hypothetical protein
MKNPTKLTYLISTGLLSAMMVMSAGMYFAQHEMIAGTVSGLGFPTYIIYPLGIAKILGIVAIWTRKSATLVEWAYAGFFFCFVLAISSHISISDGEHIPAIVAMVLLLVSYFSGKKHFA